MSFLTVEEIEALQSSRLSRETPYLIEGVSRTQLSIARHYGGIKFQGAQYDYLPDTDELIRDDVRKWIAKNRKAAA